MSEPSPIVEFRNAINAVKRELSKAVSWLYTHPEVWPSDFVDEIREMETEIREILDEMVSRAVEEAQSVAD
ncbi:MAG: hypothetical protein QW734_07910 [Candidatus Bathyarchaeia archaeon]